MHIQERRRFKELHSVTLARNGSEIVEHISRIAVDIKLPIARVAEERGSKIRLIFDRATLAPRRRMKSYKYCMSRA